MDEDRTLAAEALIGDDSEAFMRSELGRTVLGIAELEAQDAIQELKSASDLVHIRELQNRIWRAESFGSWLTELIDRGSQAIQAIQHEGTTDE